MKQEHRIGFVGGDSRQFYMIEQWRQVPCFAPDAALYVYARGNETYTETVTRCSTLVELTEICDVLVCPVPLSRDGEKILSAQSDENERDDLRLTHLASNLKQGHRLFGGNLTPSLLEHCNMNGIWYCDFMKMEDVGRKNAIATAEGAIAEAICESTGNLHMSKCLVIGYGRCGKVLCKRLRGMRARVDVFERGTEWNAILYVDGFLPTDTDTIIAQLGEYDYIFNTAPCQVLTADWIARMKKETVIIDIASMPGGVDIEACEEASIKRIHALGLPGKYAPRASAEVLIRAMKRAMES